MKTTIKTITIMSFAVGSVCGCGGGGLGTTERGFPLHNAKTISITIPERERSRTHDVVEVQGQTAAIVVCAIRSFSCLCH